MCNHHNAFELLVGESDCEDRGKQNKKISTTEIKTVMTNKVSASEFE
jgi:hypothetical protein